MKNIDDISFRQDMRELRSGKYGELIKIIRKKLGFGDDVSNASMEALFIVATEDVFLDEPYKAKGVLVALGLVRRYSRHGAHALAGKKNSVGMRREQFFDEIGETKISLETQRQNDGRWINEVADYLCGLYVNGKIESYRKKAEARYKSSVTDYIPDDELPALSDIGKRPVVQDGLIEEPLSVDAGQAADDRSMLPLDDPEVTDESSDKQGKVRSGGTQTDIRLQKKVNILIAMVILLVIGAVVDWLHGYLSTRMTGNEEEAAPLIRDILVITPEIQLYPGGEGLIQLDVEPDEADIDSVNCIPDDPEVATVAHRIVTAQEEWQEENHGTQIKVQGGVSPCRQVHVTVLPDPREQFTGADRPDGKPKGNEGKEGEQ